MDVQTVAGSPRNERGGGQVSRQLLTAGQFGSRQLTVTWVEGQPGSQQALRAHPAREQVYVIVQGRGRMLAGAEASDVGRSTLVFVPPGTPHAIRNPGPGSLVSVSATSPPFRGRHHRPEVGDPAGETVRAAQPSGAGLKLRPAMTGKDTLTCW